VPKGVNGKPILESVCETQCAVGEIGTMYLSVPLKK
jgi:hypothetical protein